MPKLLYAPERLNSITCNGDGHTTLPQPWNYWQLLDAGSRNDNFLFSLVIDHPSVEDHASKRI